jgi:hypothetical protein
MSEIHRHVVQNWHEGRIRLFLSQTSKGLGFFLLKTAPRILIAQDRWAGMPFEWPRINITAEVCLVQHPQEPPVRLSKLSKTPPKYSRCNCDAIPDLNHESVAQRTRVRLDD